MPESLKTRAMRHWFNFFPAFRGSGGRITYIAADFGEVHVRLALSLWTRNYVGTLYGGSMYGAVDPIYMVMLIQRLGPGYIVWDKAASIRFLAPGRKTLRATFRIDDAELETVRALADAAPSVDRNYTVELVDPDGVVCARVEKTLYIKKKPDGSSPGPVASRDGGPAESKGDPS